MSIVEFPDSSDSEESRKSEMARTLSSLELDLDNLDLEIEKCNGFKLPLDQIPALGMAFSALPESFRTVVGTVDVPTLLSITDKSGNPLNPSVLQSFNDGSGLMGSFRDATNGFEQARFHTADPGTITTTATSAINPEMIFMAVAMAQINKKLDGIQEAQDEMFSYMLQKDKADLRGNTKTLADTLEGYRHNWNNATWINSAHMKTVDIKQESDKSIIHLRQQILEKLNPKSPVEIRLSVDMRLGDVLERLKEYQIAVYNYAFAAFLEPMLSENYAEDYLQAIAQKIADQSIRYREMYTNCYNAIESSAKSSVDSMVLGGLSFVGKALGEAIAATPLGEHTPIDEAIGEASKGIGQFNDGISNQLMEKLHQAKNPNTVPFKESIESVSLLYNKPMRILADCNNIYLIPNDSAA